MDGAFIRNIEVYGPVNEYLIILKRQEKRDNILSNLPVNGVLQQNRKNTKEIKCSHKRKK